MFKKVIINADGGARGNPGPSAIGGVIREGDKVLCSYSETIGVGTNNEAEYKSLLMALEKACQYTNNEVDVFMDSLLVVKQMRGEWAVNSVRLNELFLEAKDKEKRFKIVRFEHVPRTDVFQSKADILVNKALDEDDNTKKVRKRK
ncbi:Ribonuclease HI [Candidatus Tiddalikarchaeum anstoanum]|nr:Ribonuclease HI [Candidatus Tiddalikarchaeum anstoanum]